MAEDCRRLRLVRVLPTVTCRRGGGSVRRVESGSSVLEKWRAASAGAGAAAQLSVDGAAARDRNPPVGRAGSSGGRRPLEIYPFGSRSNILPPSGSIFCI